MKDFLSTTWQVLVLIVLLLTLLAISISASARNFAETQRQAVEDYRECKEIALSFAGDEITYSTIAHLEWCYRQFQPNLKEFNRHPDYAPDALNDYYEDNRSK